MPMVMRHDEQYGRENSRSLRSIRHHRRYLISMKMSCCALQWNDYAALLNTYSKRKFDSLFIQIKIISVVSCWSPNTAKLKEAFETLFNYASIRVHPFYSPSHLFLRLVFHFSSRSFSPGPLQASRCKERKSFSTSRSIYYIISGSPRRIL